MNMSMSLALEVQGEELLRKVLIQKKKNLVSIILCTADS